MDIFKSAKLQYQSETGINVNRLDLSHSNEAAGLKRGCTVRDGDEYQPISRDISTKQRRLSRFNF
jgi:hypothetical protein